MPKPFPIKFCDARLRDLDEIAGLAQLQIHPVEPGEAPIMMNWYDVAHWAFKEHNGIYVALDCESDVLGACGMVLRGKALELTFLAVAPEVRRLRIGSQLLEHAKHAMDVNACRKVVAEVRAKNLNARKFLVVNGFQPAKNARNLSINAARVPFVRFVWKAGAKTQVDPA